MRFDLIDLRLFVHVHQESSITRGAVASHMTLASASERIRGMEDALGAPLFKRERRGVRPTTAGDMLLHHARLVLQQIDRLQGDLRAFGNGLRSEVRLFGNTSALSEHLPRRLATFLVENRGASIDVEERPSYQIADALRRGACDLGVLSGATDLEGLQSWPIAADPLVVLVPQHHRFARRSSVRFADLLTEPFVGLVDGHALTAYLAQQARRLAARIEYRVQISGFEAVCHLVDAGLGVAIVPQAVVRRRRGGPRSLALGDDWAMRQLVIAVRDIDALSDTARQLVRHLGGAAQVRRLSKRPV